MSRPAHYLVAAMCALWLTSGHVDAAHGAQPATECRDWRVCRDQALAAEASADGERFHDLAWRAVQVGTKDDAELMYLLARAQVMSGRPSDALVMLRRLAEMGVATDADTLDIFSRLREREGWMEMASILADATRRVTATAPPVELAAKEASAKGAAELAPTLPVRDAAPPSAATVPPVKVAKVPLRGEEALRLDDTRVASGGFAYDAVSGRFLLGSTDARKIVVVDEPSRRAADLVRGDSAGFRQMVAMQIDPRRGDLWVVSNDAPTPDVAGGATLHKLQLVAGRPLGRLEAPSADGAVRFTDLSVTPAGAVLLVDAEGRRVYRASARAESLVSVATLKLDGLTAIASADSDTYCYVAHAEGVSRVDLGRRVAEPVVAASKALLGGITRLWWHDGALIVVRTEPSGTRVAERLQLDRRGTTVVGTQAIDVSLPHAPLPIAMTIAGGDLFVMTDGSSPGPAGDDAPGQVVVRRVRLRQ